MDQDERAVLEAACLSALGIPYQFVYVWHEGALWGVKVQRLDARSGEGR